MEAVNELPATRVPASAGDSQSPAGGPAPRSRTGQRRESTALLLSAPALVLLALTLFAPIAYSLVTSLYQTNLVQQTSSFVGLSNYVDLIFHDNVFRRSIINTLVMMAVTIPVELALGLVGALLLNTGFRGHRVVLVVLLLPQFISPAVAASIFGMMLDESFGPVNFYLDLLGLPAVPWTSGSGWALGTIMLIDVWQQTPFVMLLLFAGLQGLSKEVYEAASVDGANALNKLRYLTMPLLKPIILMVVLLRLISLTKVVEAPTLLTFGGPGTSSTTTAFYSYVLGFRDFRMGYAAANGVCLMLLFGVLAWIFYRTMKGNE